MPQGGMFADLLVGNDHADDAAVWRLNDEQALVATTDFFMPIVDDPHDFGRIAAANALSDVYAMGGRPILALAILGMPVAKLPAEQIRAILAGGASICAEAKVPIAGGHSIDSAEPIYGLVALGLVHPDRVLTNREAKPGDRLLLTKPLGVGVLSAALKRGLLDDDGYRALVASTTRLNHVGADLAALDGVHAMTDVTGFGLLGHAMEMARGSRAGLEIDAAAIPVLPGVMAHLEAGVRTGASARNWESYGADMRLPEGFAPSMRDLLTDPQTSGGLLVAVAPEAADRALALARRQGFADACLIGRVAAGNAGIRVFEAA